MVLGRVFNVFGGLCYLLRQNCDCFLVFGISQIDAVDGEDGIANVQASTSVCGLAGMDL